MDATAGTAPIRPGAVEINTIVYISALEKGEQGSSRRLAEDLEPLADREGGLHFHYYPAESVNVLVGYLDFVASRARSNHWRPLIHIDAHGDEHKGLQVGRDEFISWDKLVSVFRKINVATENNLIVALAACQAFHLIKNVTFLDKVPFYTLLAPVQIVTAGLLEKRLRAFYTDVLSKRDLAAARDHLGQEFGYFHAEHILAITIARYLRDHGVGKGLARRTEDVLTQRVNFLDEKELTHLGAHRKYVKRMIKPVQEANLKQLINRFLFGRKMAMSFDDLMQLARGAG